MKIHEALEDYLGFSQRAVAVVYKTVAFVGFSAGLSLAVIAVFTPEDVVASVPYPTVEAALSLADDLRVSPRFLVALYGFLVSTVAAAFYLFTKGFVGSVRHEAVSAHQVGLRFVVFVSFAVGFVGARAVVVTAELVGEETSSGSFLGLPIQQLEFGAFHIHHYFYGFVTLAVIGWIAVFRDDYSKRLVAVLYGLGMGVFMDEVGMLLTDGAYYSRSTYFAVVFFVAVFLTALYWDLRRGKTDGDTPSEADG
ncbi:hypothetical protein EGH25_11695 [Haladaptatus sp. F3-133]|jgi:hypothetical protein|uniref:Uncharacterized protein n=1 Tax=Halorutilus salinus TaxID=2487751 RepID=A0A9Q4GHL0_9EURY|nr:hypothetical protein [Halorutilus salinus]MCX2820012.1 hypothetical protein [Halorutilus salinus]